MRQEKMSSTYLLQRAHSTAAVSTDWMDMAFTLFNMRLQFRFAWTNVVGRKMRP